MYEGAGLSIYSDSKSIISSYYQYLKEYGNNLNSMNNKRLMIKCKRSLST